MSLLMAIIANRSRNVHEKPPSATWKPRRHRREFAASSSSARSDNSPPRRSPTRRQTLVWCHPHRFTQRTNGHRGAASSPHGGQSGLGRGEGGGEEAAVNTWLLHHASIGQAGPTHNRGSECELKRVLMRVEKKLGSALTHEPDGCNGVCDEGQGIIGGR
jgi:hypothetical protein